MTSGSFGGWKPVAGDEMRVLDGLAAASGAAKLPGDMVRRIHVLLDERRFDECNQLLEALVPNLAELIAAQEAEIRGGSAS